jgi:hypothetical protein
MADIKNKSRISAQAGVLLPAEVADRALIVNSTGEVKSSVTTATELGYLSGVTSSIQAQLDDNATDLNNHITNPTGAHEASAISVVPAGNLAATEVQAALEELQLDIDSRALDSEVIKKDGSVGFQANQSMGGFRLTQMATPTAASDAATKGYVDNALEGLRPKEAVRVATTANITLSGLLTIDGVSLSANDRVLVKDQTLAEENGIYVAASGAWTRATDFDSLSPIDEINKAFVAVQEGTTNAGKLYVQFGTVNTLDVDPINFTFFNSISTLVGGDGITVSGANLSVDHDGEGFDFVAGQLVLELDGTTLQKSASGLRLSNTTVVAGTYGSESTSLELTIDAQGRITAASENPIQITASQVSDFNEAAQDAVGALLQNTASVSLVYDDSLNTLEATVIPAGVDHDQLLNFVANKHVDHSTVQIATAAGTSGLTGGGDITATRNLSVDIIGTTAETSANDADSILIYDDSASALRRMTRANFLVGSGGVLPTDILETSFSAANDQTTPADVTGLAFSSSSVRGFEALVTVAIDATSDRFETFHLLGVNKGSGFDMSVTSVGDDSGVVFSITPSGQVQYTSTDVAGFVSNTVKFRARTTSV